MTMMLAPKPGARMRRREILGALAGAAACTLAARAQSKAAPVARVMEQDGVCGQTRFLFSAGAAARRSRSRDKARRCDPTPADLL